MEVLSIYIGGCIMIGRKEEKAYLQNLVNEIEPQFIAVFGRRRIGKTYLVRESFEHNFFFQHTGISNHSLEKGSHIQSQLEKFAESLKDAGYEGDLNLTSWNEAFGKLKELIDQSDEKKKVLFIDELSWMDTKNSGLISALESFWNGWVTSRKEKDVILIVCASATYWMIDNIVNSKGGLHNRLTGQIHLKPFSLGACEEYLMSRNMSYNRHQLLQCYMILGGVPYYWSLLKKGKSIPQNIDELFFKEGAPLQNEFDNLYSALFVKPKQYIQIIKALSGVNKGITREEISKKTGISSSGELTRKLKELENCGFIRTYLPFGNKRNNSVYQLIDNYTLFYNKFIKNNVHEENYWQNQINTPKLNSWSGIAFEKVCLEHIPQIKKALGISGVYTEVNAWQCEADLENGIHGSQIDLIIVRKDQIINICEMKYSDDDFIVDSKFDRSIKRKLSDFKKKTHTKYSLHPTLITTYDVPSTSYSDELQAILTSDDLFAS